jgi:CelD/BcsL family acetyltransferase involved in cellulose biosynthesis
MDPIGNLSGIVKRRVDGAQLQAKQQLMEAILAAWRALEIDAISHPVEFVAWRLAAVAQNNGVGIFD